MTASLTIIRPREFIVIAADSCESEGLGKQTGSSCKTVAAGNFVYVPNSLVKNEDPPFDLDAILKQIGTAESLRERVLKIRQLVCEPLAIVLAAGRKQDKTGFMETFKTRRPLGLTIAGIENGKLASVNLDFQIPDLKAWKIRLAVVERWCPEPGYSRAVATNAVAEAQFRARFPKEHPEYWLGDVDSVAKTAELFVQQAIDEKLPGVAPPISVLVITTNGFDWRKRGLCANG